MATPVKTPKCSSAWSEIEEKIAAEMLSRGSSEQYKALKHSTPSSKEKGTTETEILRSIRDFLRLHGWKVVRIHQSLGSERGIPDLVAIREGQTVWIEVKTPKGQLSEHQKRWLQDLEDHGGWWIVARSVEDVEHLARGDGRV